MEATATVVKIPHPPPAENDPHLPPKKGGEDRGADRGADQSAKILYFPNVQGADQNLQNTKSGILSSLSSGVQKTLGADQNSLGADRGGDLFFRIGDQIWISTKGFFLLVGKWKNQRNARDVLSNAFKKEKPWKGHQLIVRTVQSNLGGGQSGESYLVLLTSLPQEYQQKFYGQHPELLAPPTIPFSEPKQEPKPASTPQKKKKANSVNEDKENQTETEETSDESRLDKFRSVNSDWDANLQEKQRIEALNRFKLIEPFIGSDRKGRKKAIQEYALALQAEAKKENDDSKSYTWQAIYKILQRYDRGGMAGLVRKPREEKKKRVDISRQWDRFAKSNAQIEPVYEQIINEIEICIKSLWRKGKFLSAKKVALAATIRLKKLTETALGRELTPLEKALCEIKQGRVNLSKYNLDKLYNIKHNDNSKFRQHILPGIERDYEGLMFGNLIIADVHPLDSFVKTINGKDANGYAISWLDAATKRVFMTIIFSDGKGKAKIKRTDVIRSFCRLCAVWGLPKILYFDNGGEYNWAEIIGGFNRLTRNANMFSHYDITYDAKAQEMLRDIIGEPEKIAEVQANIKERIEEGRNIIKAIPYNARAKSIEPVFRELERFFAHILGWVGGNRMNKKTHQVGKKPLAYEGTKEEYLRDIDNAINHYHATPQYGRLKGHSPNSLLERFRQAGWKATPIREETLLFAFATPPRTKPTRQIKKGGVLSVSIPNIGSLKYQHEDLCQYAREGQELKVLVPFHDPSFVFVEIPGKSEPLAVPRLKKWNVLDPNGAKASANLQKHLDRQIRESGRNIEIIDNGQLTQEFIDEWSEAGHGDPGIEFWEGEFAEIRDEEIEALEAAHRRLESDDDANDEEFELDENFLWNGYDEE